MAGRMTFRLHTTSQQSGKQKLKEDHVTSYLMGIGGPFPGVNRGWGVTLTTHPI
jgi:hypothetical protein